MNNFKQLQKRTAYKKWIEGSEIYVIPCKIYPDFNNPWTTPYKMPNLKDFKEDHKKTVVTDDRKVLLIYRENKELFTLFINEYIAYDCQCNQTGKYPHFYILEK